MNGSVALLPMKGIIDPWNRKAYMGGMPNVIGGNIDGNHTWATTLVKEARGRDT